MPPYISGNLQNPTCQTAQIFRWLCERKVTRITKESRLGKLCLPCLGCFFFPRIFFFRPKTNKTRETAQRYSIFLSLLLSFFLLGRKSTGVPFFLPTTASHVNVPLIQRQTRPWKMPNERTSSRARTHKWKLKAQILTRSRRLMRTRAQHPPGPGPSWNRTRAFPVCPSLVPHHSLSFARIDR